MAQNGELVQWNDDRGFGFIKGSDGQRHFVHISAIGRIATRPRIGDHVHFEPGLGADGRPLAKAVRIVGANLVTEPDARGRGGKKVRSQGGQSWRIAAALLLVGLLVSGNIAGNIPWQVLLAYAAMSSLSLLAYRADKIFAEAGHWRISEVTLHALDLCLGIAGGMLAQALFRHKTQKSGFGRITLLVLAVHLLWLAGLASGLIVATDLIALLPAALRPGA